MNDAGLVRNMNRPRKCRQQPRRTLFRLERAREHAVQAAALQQLKCHKRKSANLADVKDLDDVDVT